MSELKNKTAKGIGWGFVDNVANSGIMAIVTIVLARILSPDEFGIISMTTIFITLATSFVDSGFSGALTRMKKVDEADLNTVFYLNLGLSAVFYCILFFCAPLIASFFKVPELSTLVRVLGVVLILTAFSIVQKVIFVRKLDFKSQAIISLASSTISGGVSIAMAFMGYGVWSLVALQVLRMGISTILLWIFSSWKPALVFSLKSFREMFSFGGKLVVVSLISIVWNEVHSLVIGKFYTPFLLGQYSRAEKFKNMVTLNVSIVMQKVGYPVLSHIRDEKERQVRVFRKLLKTTTLINFTAVLGLAAIARPLMMVLIGEQWLPAVPMLRILCVSGVFIPLLFTNVNIINANGRSDLTLWLEIIKIALLSIPVTLGIMYSIEYMLWGVAISSFISYIIHALFVKKVIDYPLFTQLKDIFPSFLVAVIMCGLVWMVGLINIPDIFLLILQLFAGVGIVVLVYEKIYRNEEYYDIKKALLKALRIKKNSF